MLLFHYGKSIDVQYYPSSLTTLIFEVWPLSNGKYVLMISIFSGLPVSVCVVPYTHTHTIIMRNSMCMVMQYLGALNFNVVYRVFTGEVY